MVLTKEELIGSLKHEVHVLLHLAGKVDKAKIDYRPTPKQRSILELMQYMAIMAPAQLQVIKGGGFTREAMTNIWGPAEAASKKMTFDDAVAAITKQSDSLAAELGSWSDADLRGQVDMFGTMASRGYLLVNLVISGFAAYRAQLFTYLKACGREELNTMNLWAGIDAPM